MSQAPKDQNTKPLPAIRCSTGVRGLDHVLDGGLAVNRLYLVHGQPGSGKTTLALQFLGEGVRLGERVLHVTLSETRAELESVAESHGISLEKIDLVDLSAVERNLGPEAQSTLLHPSELELSRTMQLLYDTINDLKPSRVVLDSLSEFRLLAQDPLRFRRQVLSLKSFFSRCQCTVLMLDDNTASLSDQQVESIAHGVIELEQLRPDYGGERRRLSVKKMRGSKFRGGYHDYMIRTGGLDVFPRLVAAEQKPLLTWEVAASGLAPLDALLRGGLDRGSSTLFIGPPGTGKSTLATQFAIAAAARGEKSLILTFDENVQTFRKRCEGLGMHLGDYLESGRLRVQQLDPAELSPGEFAARVRHAVEHDDCRVVIIDSLNGYLHAMPDERFLVIQLHELLSFLSHRGVLSLLVLAQAGMMGQMHSNIDVSYLADSVLLFRYFEFEGEVKKALSVVKKRGGDHESTIRELRFEPNVGVRIGEPLSEFHGVLTGVPVYRGANADILRSGGAPATAKRTILAGAAPDKSADATKDPGDQGRGKR